MADRKVLVKYYPPDFDPEKLAQKGRIFRNYDYKRRRGGGKLMNVRFMFPFTMCCGMCNEFIYIGTKFNSRVEKIRGEDYLGIPIWRFYGRCPHCRAEITFKTDPQNTEYILESGGTRTYDPRKDADLAESTLKERLEEEIASDSMKALEHKTHSTANELQALEQLDELRKINKRFLSRETTLDKALDWLKAGGIEDSIQELNETELEEFEEARKEMQFRLAQEALGGLSSSSSDDEDPNNNKSSASLRPSKRTHSTQSPSSSPSKTNDDSSSSINIGGKVPSLQSLCRVVIKKQQDSQYMPCNMSKAVASTSGITNILSGYASD